jgi:hypothetical protein
LTRPFVALIILILAVGVAYGIRSTSLPLTRSTRSVTSFTTGGSRTGPASPTEVLPIVTIEHGFQSFYGSYPQGCTINFNTGQTSCPAEPILTLVIDDQVTWSATYQRYNCGGASCSIPHVDFESQTVLAVYLGLKTTGGYNIRVVSATLSQQTVTVHVLDTEYAYKCGLGVTQAFTEPYDIVAIPKVSAGVTFDLQTSLCNS